MVLGKARVRGLDSGECGSQREEPRAGCHEDNPDMSRLDGRCVLWRGTGSG